MVIKVPAETASYPCKNLTAPHEKRDVPESVPLQAKTEELLFLLTFTQELAWFDHILGS